MITHGAYCIWPKFLNCSKSLTPLTGITTLWGASPNPKHHSRWWSKDFIDGKLWKHRLQRCFLSLWAVSLYTNASGFLIQRKWFFWPYLPECLASSSLPLIISVSAMRWIICFLLKFLLAITGFGMADSSFHSQTLIEISGFIVSILLKTREQTGVGIGIPSSLTCFK